MPQKHKVSRVWDPVTLVYLFQVCPIVSVSEKGTLPNQNIKHADNYPKLKLPTPCHKVSNKVHIHKVV